MQNLQGASRYAYSIIRGYKERPAYHNLSHTLQVGQAARLLAKGEGLSSHECNLLYTAAAYHDVGYSSKAPVLHKEHGVKITREVLPRYGYSLEEIDIITKAILTTKLPQKPSTLLEEVLCDADLFDLHLHSFPTTAKKVRAEMKQIRSLTYTNTQWYLSVSRFLRNQGYFTKTAQAIGQAGIERNLLLLKQNHQESLNNAYALSRHDSRHR
jgi:uncharacterized protein